MIGIIILKKRERIVYLCYSNNDFKYYGKTRIVFYIDLKKDYDDRKYCKIEDVEP